MEVNQNDDISLYCKLLGLYFVCLIVGSMNIGAVGSLLRVIALLPIAIWFLTNRKISLNRIICSAILFVAWTGCSYFWTIDEASTYTRMISQITFLILIASVSGYSYNEREILFLKHSLVWSSRITAVVLLLTGSYAEGRLYLSGMIDEDPNYLCGYFFFAIVWCVQLLVSAEAKLYKKAFALGELLVYVYLLFSTGSRGGLFATVAAIIVAVVFLNREGNTNNRAWQKILAIVAVLLLTSYVSNFLPSEVAERYTYDAIANSGGTGRYEIWTDTLMAFREYPFWRQIIGYGAGVFKKITYLYSFTFHNVAHNIFLENLAELGFVGLLVYVLHLLAYWVSSIRRKDVYSCAVLAGLVVLSLSTSIEVFKPYWNIMIFVLVNELGDHYSQEEGGML